MVIQTSQSFGWHVLNFRGFFVFLFFAFDPFNFLAFGIFPFLSFFFFLAFSEAVRREFPNTFNLIIGQASYKRGCISPVSVGAPRFPFPEQLRYDERFPPSR